MRRDEISIENLTIDAMQPRDSAWLGDTED